MPNADAAVVRKHAVVASSAPTTSDSHVTTIVQSLQARLAAGVDITVISAEVEAAFAAYSTARITQFVPVLVESRVKASLCRKRST